MKKTKQPGVYLLKYGDRVLYVGCSSNLARRSRVRGDKAHMARSVAMLHADSVKLIPCKSLVEAQRLEERLIRKYSPQFNTQRPCAPADLERTARIIRDNW